MRFLCVLATLGLVAGITVDTQYGPIRGQSIPVNNGLTTSDIYTFYNIPFAASTAGANRFRAPVPPEPWTAVRDADYPGSLCPQKVAGFAWWTHPGWTDFGEDCLNINLYVPKNHHEGPYAVMVWFYGGAFQSGGNLNYPGHFLASHGVIVVCPNYRVGNLGFAYTGDDAAPGNAGLLDQKMALEWVRDNIANFNGDPTKVTIFGQSAGAASSSIHVVSPASQGLFSQAIMESGTGMNFWSYNPPASHPENYIKQVAEELDCYDDDNFVMMDCLRELSWYRVYKGNFTCAPGYFCLGMVPVLDGPDGMLPAPPSELRASGNFTKGPIITGITRDDGSFYTLEFIPESNKGNGFNRTDYLYYLRNNLLGFWSPRMSNQTLDDTVNAMDYNYSPWPYQETDYYGNRQSVNELVTDGGFGYAWDQQARSQSEVADTFTYVFDYRGRNSTQVFPEWMGVPHMGELPYVWGYPLLKLNPEVRNDSLIFFDIVDWTDEDTAYAIYWTQLWANFAKYGNPTPTPVEAPNNLGPTTWAPYTFEEMNYLYISNVSMYVGQEYRQQDYAFYTSYLPYIWRDVPDEAPGAPTRYSPEAPVMSLDGMSGDTVAISIHDMTIKMLKEKSGIDMSKLEAFIDL